MGPSNSTAARARILCIGNDSVLLSSRQLVLETAGYAVVSVSGYFAARIPFDDHFDLVVLCHTVREDLTQRVVEMLRMKHPSLPILPVTTYLHAEIESTPHLLRSVPGNPEAILNRVRQILGTRAPSASTASISGGGTAA